MMRKAITIMTTMIKMTIESKNLKSRGRPCKDNIMVKLFHILLMPLVIISTYVIIEQYSNST